MKKLLIVSIFIFLCMPLVGCSGHSHTLTEWETLSPATCEDAQVLIRHCTGCDYEETKDGISALGHSYATTIISPSSTQTGYTRHKCTCGDEYLDTYKCLITFENTTQNPYIQVSDLPAVNGTIVNREFQFTGISATSKYKPVGYKISELGGNEQPLLVGTDIQNSCKITIIWDLVNPYTPSQDEVAFNELIQKIQKLEEISALYNQSKGLANDVNLRVMQYIRNTRYNDDEWNGFGGALESDFSAFVDANEGSLDLSTLQSLAMFAIPSTGKKVDFVHMVAILNVIVNPESTAENIYDLVGFGGDICQLAVEVKKSTTGQTASDLFMAQNSSFSSYDLYADLDAVNLGVVYSNLSVKSLSGAMEAYYKNLTETEQKSKFIANALPNLNTASVASLASGIVSRLSGNLYLQYWAMQNGLNFTNDSAIILACVTEFADYLI